MIITERTEAIIAVIADREKDIAELKEELREIEANALLAPYGLVVGSHYNVTEEMRKRYPVSQPTAVIKIVSAWEMEQLQDHSTSIWIRVRCDNNVSINISVEHFKQMLGLK